MRCFLRGQPEVEVIEGKEDTFASPSALDAFVAGCDAIVHLAGMNRGDEQQLYETNVALTQELIDACERGALMPHVVFASSIHIYRDTMYGKSKKKCSEMLKQWSERTGAAFTNLVLPNVFGEHGQPFYNSVVATFCFQLANGEEPRIIEDGTVELIHVQDVAEGIHAILVEGGPTDERVFSGAPLTVSDLLGRLSQLAQLYRAGLIPHVEDRLDLCLFNTLRSYLYPQHYPSAPTLHADARGNLFEAVKSLNGGQCFISTTNPGVTRGNHYHVRKIERFLVLRGEAEIGIRRLFFNEVKEFRVSGAKPEYIDIPTLHTHNIRNVGQGELITLFWANEIFEPENPDTFAEPV